MGTDVTITAIVGGIPGFIRLPQTRPGETRLQSLVRQHPHAWNNLIEHLRSRFGISDQLCRQLSSVDLRGITGPLRFPVTSEIENWANIRMPTHYRTMRSLTNLKQRSFDGSYQGVQLVQILFPRELNPMGDSSVEKELAALGAEVVSFPFGSGRREMNLVDFLPKVKGAFLWSLPGGSRLDPTTTALALKRVLLCFDSDPSAALYQDGFMSFVVRVDTLHRLARTYSILPANLRELARVATEAGFGIVGDSGREFALCDFEDLYGSPPTPPKPQAAARRRRLFRR